MGGGPDPRALTFGDDAEHYERARPAYPGWVFDAAAAAVAGRALDVGCGTGVAARQLRDRGWQVLGVEPDPRMAAVARNHGIDVVTSTFEDWQPEGRRVDLVVSAQAWHWVDADIGTEKAADLLVDGGRFAAFWNGHRHTPEVAALIRAVYARHAHAIASTRPAAVPAGGVEEAATRALDACPSFGAVDHRAESWEQPYAVEEWLEVETSFGAHRVYPERTRHAIVEDIAEALAPAAPITVTWTTTLVGAVRLPRASS